MQNMIDPEDNFPTPRVAKVLNTLKPALIFGLDKSLKLLPKESVVDSLDKCDCSEMRRQYVAFERAKEKWIREGGFGGRSVECVELMQKIYFTIQQHEANYKILSAYVLDEYRKIRENNEQV